MGNVVFVIHRAAKQVLAAGLRTFITGEGGASGVGSFNSRTGAVTLSGSDVTTALGYLPANNASLAAVALSGSYADLSGKPALGTAAATASTAYATAAQGTKADSAVQPGALATVATSGSYNDLSAKPTIPTTAAQVSAIALSEKGAASGVATLDGSSKIPLAQLPATAITEASVVASQAAMIALTAQTGDVAIRTDISTSFILAAEPASTLGNWQQLLSPAAGGGAPAGSSVPQSLGAATPGVSTSASRDDHVHAMPSAADVGATPASHAGAGGTAHANAIAAGAAGFMTGADKTKLDAIASGATANANTDSLIEGTSNLYHTVARVRAAPLTGLSLAAGTAVAATDTVLEAFGKLQKQIADQATTVSGKQAALVSGTNIKTINGTSLLGGGDLAVSGVGMANPMTTAGDIIVGGSSGAPSRLPKGSALQVLRMNAAGTAQEYADPALGVSLSVVQTFTGAKTLALADINTYNVSQDATAQAVALPAQATVAWTANAEIHIERGAAGVVTVVGAAGVQINGTVAGTFTLGAQYSVVTLKRKGPNLWTLFGNAS